MSYIEREAFVESQRHLYCENCAKRKGMKRGKMQFVYEIGDAPCRACGYGDVIDDAEDFPAADVRPVVLCRDCVRWKEAEGGWHICVYYRDVPAVRMENDFCSRGKKREES